MGRRTSSGRIGAPTFGGLLADAQTITSDENTDIILDPTGTGRVLVDGHVQLQAQSNLRFADQNSSNYVAFRASTNISSDVVWTLPDADGTNGYVLTTNGAGVLSWSQASVDITDENSDSNDNYLVFTTQTSGSASSIKVSATSRELVYIPSTGALEATLFRETSASILKENFRDIDGALSKVLCLNGKIYDRKNGGLKDEVGLIAEEVASVIPNIVGLDKNGEPDTISYSRLSVYLIESLKEITERLSNLESKVSSQG